MTSEYDKCINGIFNVRYSVSITAECLSLANSYEELDSTMLHDDVYGEECVFNDNVTRTESNTFDPEHLLNLIYNKPQDTNDMFKGSVKIENDYAFDTILTIANMCDVVSSEGGFTLLNYKDALLIVECIDKYKAIIEDRIILEPHYRKPPDEDMNSLELLKTKLLNISKLCSVVSPLDVFLSDDYNNPL